MSDESKENVSKDTYEAPQYSKSDRIPSEIGFGFISLFLGVNVVFFICYLCEPFGVWLIDYHLEVAVVLGVPAFVALGAFKGGVSQKGVGSFPMTLVSAIGFSLIGATIARMVLRLPDLFHPRVPSDVFDISTLEIVFLLISFLIFVSFPFIGAIVGFEYSHKKKTERLKQD